MSSHGLLGNSIPGDQNSDLNISRLAAQRRLYTDAKTLLAIQIALSVPCVIAWSVTVAVSSSLAVYAACWGMAVARSDILYFTPKQRALKLEAAEVQELFDCDVLGLEWSSIKVGARPEPEMIIQAERRYRRGDPDCAKVLDWYPRLSATSHCTWLGSSVSEPTAGGTRTSAVDMLG